jgi:hypothetical protein
MSKLAAVAERLAQTRRWLDQEVDRLAARLDQLEKRAPVAIQNAHRILDDQQRDLETTEQMVQHWLSASAEASGGSNKPSAPQHAPSPLARAQPKQSSDLAPGPVDPAYRFLDEQQKDVGRLERALQALATEIPEPQTAGAGPLTRAQAKPSNDAAAALDSRRLLDEQHKDEGGLERALQTLANKLQGPQPAGTGPLARPRLLDESQKSEDPTKPAARKLGVVRVA